MFRIISFILSAVALSSAQSIFDIFNSRICTTLPPLPANGGFGSRTSFANGFVQYTCNECYTLHGLPYNICSNQRWENTAPTCIRDNNPCLDRPCDVNAECSSLGNGRYTCSCKSGYTGNGKKSFYNNNCASYSGFSSGKTGCERSCGLPYQWVNADYTPKKSVYNRYDTITWTCIPPFKQRSISGSTRAVTQFCNYSFWSGTSPTCLKSLCDDPVAPGNGMISPSSRLTWNEGNNVTYSCNNGFKLVGDPVITCLKADSFANPPSCVSL